MTRGHRAELLLWMATVVLIALNLRPFLTAIGPLAPSIQASTGMSLTTLSWLTLLPMAMMGIGTWFAPLAARCMGMRLALAGALIVITLGNLARFAGNAAFVLIGSAVLCGCGVALVQGLLPGLIKQRTPWLVAPMMGVYSASLMGGGALGAQLSPLAIQRGASWQAALALWSVPALFATLLALAVVRSPAIIGSSVLKSDTRWLLRRQRTWLLIACFGLMNGGYAAMVAWLAPFYQSLGWSAPRSGFLVAVLSVAQAAAALTLPVLARKQPDRRPWLMLTLIGQVAGFALLAWWPLGMPLVTVIILGAGLGGFFALIMVAALDHLRDPMQAGALNAFMQGGGFILAALAPWVVARLHEATGGYVVGWQAQLVAVLITAVLAIQLAPRHYDAVMKPPASS